MSEQRSSRAKVLVIEDSDFIHRLLKVRLRQEPLEIVSAHDGTSGMAMVHSANPDVILLDVQLPDISGFNVLAQLKADAELREIPVILISSNDDVETKVRGLDLGAIDFVPKPFNIAELKARLRSAIRIYSLIRLLAQRAQIDGLTGLWNRTFFDDRLTQEIATARRHKRPLSLIMCDIDHFKRINDEYGHPFGDQALQTIGTLLDDGRASDVACRYGGEEFAIILPDTDLNDAALVAERLRERFATMTWDGRDDLRITASFGVSQLNMTTSAANSIVLIQAADDALYDAKNAGRNRVCLHSESSQADTAHRAAG
ncbi:MAG: diguanylate cyclase [Planctomycetota bacterium]